jgi:hypothetical protein
MREQQSGASPAALELGRLRSPGLRLLTAPLPDITFVTDKCKTVLINIMEKIYYFNNTTPVV